MNPHPPLSSFPISILSLILCGELLARFVPKFSFTPIRVFLLCSALTVVPITYFSGYWGIDAANEAQVFKLTAEQIAFHQNTALLFLISLAPLILFGLLNSTEPYRGKRAVKICYSLFLALSFALCVITSFRGGELVFKHGAAVQAQPTPGQ